MPIDHVVSSYYPLFLKGMREGSYSLAEHNLRATLEHLTSGEIELGDLYVPAPERINRRAQLRLVGSTVADSAAHVEAQFRGALRDMGVDALLDSFFSTLKRGEREEPVRTAAFRLIETLHERFTPHNVVPFSRPSAPSPQ